MSDAGAIIGIGFFIVFWGFIILSFLLSIALTAFWVWMLVDAIRRENYEKENDKILWVLIVALLNWIGAAIYYFMVRKKLK